MIAWDGDAIQRYLRMPKTESVPEWNRCVNEGAEGCALRAEDNGWCGPCWRTIVPASVSR